MVERSWGRIIKPVISVLLLPPQVSLILGQEGEPVTTDYARKQIIKEEIN